MPLHTKNVLVLACLVRTVNGVFQNVSYWEPSAPFNPDEAGVMLGIANGAFADFQPLYCNLISHANFFAGTRVKYYNGDGDVWEMDSNSDEEAGDLLDTDQSLPDQDALIIQRRTNKIGRQHMGRLFIPGISEEVSNNAEVQNTLLGPNYRSQARDLASAYGSDKTWGAVLFHARHYNRKDDHLDVITYCRAMLHLGSRRDRARRLGVNTAA